MNSSDTEIGGAARAFPATSWTLLQQARGGRGDSVERLIRLYWKPVYWFIRRSGSTSNEDAKDLAQDFFTRVLLDGSLVERYQPEKGGFRPFLKAALRNFLLQSQREEGAQKRGGDVDILSLHAGSLDLPGADKLGPEEAFDLAWERSILARTLERLEERLRAEGKGVYWDVFRRYELSDRAEAVSYGEVARSLGLSADDVKNYLTAARKAFLEAAKEIVARESGPDEFGRDLAALFR